MSQREGRVGYGSGRYKLVGRAGCSDEYLHNGDGLEVRLDGRWVRVWVFSDGVRWWFEDESGYVIGRDLLGMVARW